MFLGFFQITFGCFVYISLPYKNYGIIRNIFTEWGFDPEMKREQGGWCNLFWNKDCKEKEQGIITESLIKNLWKLFYYGKNKNTFWFVNNSKYHHQEMGL